MTECDVFAIASAKGGVGKTTTSINLGAATAVVTGKSVIVVEMDLPMANVVDFLKLDLNPSRDPTLHDVLSGNAAVSDAVYQAPGNFHVLPSGTSLDGYAAADPRKLRDVVSRLRLDYDLVILDSGAGVSYETVLPLGMADVVVLVSTPRVAAVRDTKKTKKLAERIGGTIAGVVFVRSGTGKAPPVERLADFLSVELLGHVPEDGKIPESQDAGELVITYEFASSAAKSYWEIAKRLNQAYGTHPIVDRPAAREDPSISE